jgi:hypothetical protein
MQRSLFGRASSAMSKYLLSLEMRILDLRIRSDCCRAFKLMSGANEGASDETGVICRY